MLPSIEPVLTQMYTSMLYPVIKKAKDLTRLGALGSTFSDINDIRWFCWP